MIKIIQIICLVCLLWILWTVITGSTCETGSDLSPRQKEKLAAIAIKAEIKLALMEYRLNEGNYPYTAEAFHETLVQYFEDKPRKTRKRFIAEDQVVDPWNNPYQYKFPGDRNRNGSRSYDVWSLGQDGLPSDDDIGNWKKESNQAVVDNSVRASLRATL